MNDDVELGDIIHVIPTQAEVEEHSRSFHCLCAPVVTVCPVAGLVKEWLHVQHFSFHPDADSLRPDFL